MATFTTGMSGPAAVAALEALWGRVSAVATLTYAATVVCDISQPARVFDLLLTGNCLITFTGNGVALGDASLAGIDGKQMILRPKQDATGSRILTFSTGARFGTDIPSGSVTLSTAALKADRIALQYDHVAGKIDIVGYARGF